MSDHGAPFTLTLSSGGGFTGLYQGYTLASPDSVTAWRRQGAGEPQAEWSRRAAPESLAAFARDLRSLAAPESDAAGNITTRVEWKDPQGVRTWSIAGGPGPDAPEPFRTWYPRVAAYCRALAPSP